MNKELVIGNKEFSDEAWNFLYRGTQFRATLAIVDQPFMKSVTLPNGRVIPKKKMKEVKKAIEEARELVRAYLFPIDYFEKKD